MVSLYREVENTEFQCPFCGKNHDKNNFCGPILFNCFGTFSLDIVECEKELNKRKYTDEEKLLAWMKMGHYIAQNYLYRERKPNEGVCPIDFHWVLDNINLPTPSQQADNLILYISNHTRWLGDSIEIKYREISGRKVQLLIGAINESNLIKILWELTNNKLITTNQPPSQASWKPSLTIAGWNRAEDLKKVNKLSTQVFMAMKFDAEQEEFVKQYLAPAIKQMGFELKLLPDIIVKENLIDNKLRVAIRQSRFLICDLTHGNRGAYWEAGYAEGLGLPVIYICEKNILESGKDIHFDVSHQEIYSWESGSVESIDAFLDKIKDKIYLLTREK